MGWWDGGTRSTADCVGGEKFNFEQCTLCTFPSASRREIAVWREMAGEKGLSVIRTCLLLIVCHPMADG